MSLFCPHCQAPVPGTAQTDTLVACPACGTSLQPAPRSTQPTGQETVTDPHDYQPPLDDDAPRQLGRYRITLWLGSGSFGTVYKGHDEDLRRDVAIKVPHRHRVASDAHADAYLNEARVLARLDHPGIVPVYDVGRTDDGLCYVVSKFIEGTDLAGRLRRGKLPAAEAVRLALGVAEGLAHAHGRGLVHRDIKPANILLDRSGEPYVSDFGLALREESAAEGPAFAGTPAYMSPEQARGEGHRIDVRTDLYSLGVVLYEMLTGRQPFEGETIAELLEQILTRQPQPLSHLEPEVPKELDRICLKCLSKRAIDRYPDAHELADDLEHWQRQDKETRGQGDKETSHPLPVSLSPGLPVSLSGPRVVPKGLRAFDDHDAEFFLNLVPGPRERNGLPASIQFWKARIDSTDPGTAFPVGLLYGPSGCGKSSLVRAGLTPHLDPRVTAVYVEASRDATETRLLYSIRRVCPELSHENELPGLVGAVRRGLGLSHGRKLLVVLDQLEQYLHGRKEQAGNAALVAALRQADGVHIQFLLLVRDDFWLAAARLFSELELPLVEGQNLELIDLFELPHARRVLLLFGQAHGCLPDDPARLTGEQNQFLDEAVAGLADDGKVISVQLSLFAEMMKGRQWTPESLRAVGGTRGVGMAFLEETFSARTASPERRAVEKEARAVLQALLPEEGGDIKGQVRSYTELLAASGWQAHPRRFDRLLSMLDRDLRIISPTEATERPEPKAEPTPARERNADSTTDERPTVSFPPGQVPCYQLTHDFLVPALREWLTQRQRATWRGRAEMKLHERTAQWARSPQSRFLPSLPEFVTITAGVPNNRRKPEEHALMWAATRYYGSVLLGLALIAGILGGLFWDWNGRTQARRLVQAIEAAEPDEVALLIEQELPRYRRWADPLLRRVANHETADAGQRLRASLALVGRDGSQVEYLHRRLFDSSLAEFPLVRNALHPYDEQLLGSLWETLRDSHRPPRERFRAGLTLAHYVPDDDGWTDTDAAFLVDQLLQSSRDDQRELRQCLRPVADHLTDDLRVRFRDSTARSTARIAAADALADFAHDQPACLAELASGADAEQYDALLRVLSESDSRAHDLARTRLLEVAGAKPAGDVIGAGRRRAGAAVTLLHLGDRAGAASVFTADDDPEAMTQFVHRVRERMVRAETLLAWLEQEQAPRTRFALLLALGEYPIAEVPAPIRQAWQERLDGWYENDPNSAIHSATGWLLRRWNFADAVHRVDRAPRPYDPAGRREWFVEAVDGSFFTFVVFPPGEYVIGSPESDRDPPRKERRRRVRITRPFAVCDRELTREQWQRYLEATRLPADPEDTNPGPNHPASGMRWEDGVRYCHWLTKTSGLAETDQAYQQPKPGGWQIRLDRPGYRLPTEAEWEVACRAGTATTYGFGSDRELLSQYGRHLETQAGPVATLRPNMRGLFDMHGNVWEWCHDWFDPMPADGQTDPVGPAEASNKTLRGGGWDRTAWHCRSAYRHSPTADYQASYIGFRIVKTLR